MKRFFSFMVLLACQQSVFATSCDNLQSLNWLVGNWQAEDENYKTTESWQAVSANTFEGHGQTESIAKNKIVSSETLRLVMMSGEVFFWAKVANNELPVAFKLTECTALSATFENRNHDFPQTLSYQLQDQNLLTVLVAGEQGKNFSIHYSRVEMQN
ncbi:DUF6265 family protein [Thalassotalea sp. ND16A]|uniref:DUF6265 family protein n=1 Tax=Thalassotalea sp. ND16A TaxID=1535422 RepID=UPI000519FE0C|nr:DUF6265 family protein [Thalassotalea sp. ND16A]KGJ88029.1 hypothetical protein ND16A_2582 [Thalassotalea sp. ND16A]